MVWQLLSGQLREVYVKVETLPITSDLIGDYLHDDGFKQHFQSWLNTRWVAKDKTYNELLQRAAARQ